MFFCQYDQIKFLYFSVYQGLIMRCNVFLTRNQLFITNNIRNIARSKEILVVNDILLV